MTATVAMRPDTLALRWRVYGRWAGMNLLAFGGLYPLVNGLTAGRDTHHRLYVDHELAIPFMPGWIWAYLSINLLFLMPPLFMRAADMPRLGKRMLAATLAGCAIFLLLPARLGFERSLPDDPFYGAVFGALFLADGPHNLMTSLHVTYASLCIIDLQATTRRFWGSLAWAVWLAAIMASTVLVHQHHLADVASGLLLAGLICRGLPQPAQGPDLRPPATPSSPAATPPARRGTARR